MKKLLIFLISTIILISIMFLPGCGGGSGGGSHTKKLKVYQISGSGGVAYMDLITKSSNMVYAAGLEIGSNYILYYNGPIPVVESYVEDNGNIVNTHVELSKDFSEIGYNDCFNFNAVQYETTGKTTAEVRPFKPGKCKLISIAAAEGLTRTIEVLVFDGVVTEPPPGSGISVNNSGHILYVTKTESAIYNDSSGKIILPGNSHRYFTDVGEDWRAKLVGIRTVDTETVDSGDPDQVLRVGDIYVSKVPGGYIKVCWIQGEGIIWEFTDSTSFR
jgi:hypothetical protein